jgi:antitoxin (DNA-binding transcriptional repressor) of toxin-antitoxin stability system
MKFISVRDLRTSPAQVWKTLPEEKEMVITNNGRPIALLTPISDDNLEETIKAMRSARAANAIRSIQLHSVKTGKNKLTDEEIEHEIRQSREERSK